MTAAVVPATVPGRGRIGAAVVVALLLVANLTPVWAVAYWPSQDGPEHAFNAVVLRDYGRPEGAIYRKFFALNHRPVPNWATALITRGLLAVASPATADKLIVSGYLVAFYAAAAYAVRRLRPGARWEPLVLLPLGLNYFVSMGFYNLCYSLPVLLVIYGYWMRPGARSTVGRLAVLAGLSAVLYFCHIVTFGIEFGFLGLAALWAAANGGGTMADRAGRLARGLVPLVALLPPVVLSAVFVGHQPLGAFSTTITFHQRVTQFLTWTDTFRRREAAVAVAWMAACAAATAVVLARRRARAGTSVDPTDLLLVTAAATALLSLVVPDWVSGGGYVVFRVNLLAVLTWSLWVAVQDLPRVVGPALWTVGGLVTIAVLGVTARAVRVEDRFVRDYVAAAPHVRPGSTVLGISYAVGVRQTAHGRPPFDRVDCMRHTVAWVAAARGSVDVTDYEASTDYFPTVFRPELDATAILYRESPRAYRSAVGTLPDYVLLWTGGLDPQTPADRDTADDLARDYRLAFRSPDAGFTQLYERVTPTTGAAASAATSGR